MTATNQVEVYTSPEPPAQPARNVVTPMEMLAHAVERGADIATIERLAALAERMEQQRARREFDEAVASAKAEIPIIRKNRVVDFTSQRGRTNYRHEDLAEIARAAGPILAKYGLSYRYRCATENDVVSVTCILSHRGGYSEENTLSDKKDDTGNKNRLQATASTITYLQRYTLKAALGIAVSDDDDDGSAAHGRGETLSEDQAAEIEDLITSTGGELSTFLRFKRISAVRDIPAANFQKVKAEIIAVAERRKANANG